MALLTLFCTHHFPFHSLAEAEVDYAATRTVSKVQPRSRDVVLSAGESGLILDKSAHEWPKRRRILHVACPTSIMKEDGTRIRQTHFKGKTHKDI